MALIIAIQHNGHVYIGGESRIKDGGVQWKPYFINKGITIALRDTLYHSVVAQYKDHIVINSLSGPKMVRLLYENIQDIIKNSNLKSIPKGELYKTTMLVCDKNNIWMVDNSGHVENTHYGYLCEEFETKEKVHGYMKGLEEIEGFITKPKKTLKHIISTFHETRGKISIKKL